MTAYMCARCIPYSAQFVPSSLAAFIRSLHWLVATQVEYVPESCTSCWLSAAPQLTPNLPFLGQLILMALLQPLPCAVAQGREALGPLQTLDHIASDRHVGLLNVAQQGLQSKKLLCKPLLLLIEQPHMSVRISQKQCGPIDVP